MVDVDVEHRSHQLSLVGKCGETYTAIDQSRTLPLRSSLAVILAIERMQGAIPPVRAINNGHQQLKSPVTTVPFTAKSPHIPSPRHPAYPALARAQSRKVSAAPVHVISAVIPYLPTTQYSH